MAKEIIKALEIWREHGPLREGRKNIVYLDSLGKPTGGIGHLILPQDKLKVGDKISNELIDKWFSLDSALALATSLKQWKDLGVHTAEFLAALISVNFQLGDFEKKFKNSYNLLKAGHYPSVIKNLRGSLWFKQTPVRVEDFIKAIGEIK